MKKQTIKKHVKFAMTVIFQAKIDEIKNKKDLSKSPLFQSIKINQDNIFLF